MGIDKQNSRQYISGGFKGWKRYLPLINITLFIGVITLGVIGAGMFRAVPSPFTGLERIKAKPSPQQTSVTPTIQTNTALLEEYDLVPNENPFAPSRKEWEPPPPKLTDALKQEAVKLPPKEPPKKIVLSGIAITENLKKALVRNPDMKPGQQQFLYVEEGSEIGGYKVKSIEPNQIRLEWEGQESVVTIFADKENVKTFPAPGAPPYTPPQQPPPQPPHPESRRRPPHEMEMPPGGHPRAEEELVNEGEQWNEGEDEDWDEEGDEGWEEEGGEYPEEMAPVQRSHPPKAPGRRPRRR